MEDPRYYSYIDKKWKTTVKGRTTKRRIYAKHLNIVDKIALNKRLGLTHRDERVTPEMLNMQREYELLMTIEGNLTKSEHERYLEIALGVLNIIRQIFVEYDK